MIKHAEEIRDPTEYLQLVDLVLLSCAHGKELVLLTNSNPMTTQSLTEWLLASIPELAGKEALLQTQAKAAFTATGHHIELGQGPAQWHVVLSRADFQPHGNLLQMNHFLPALVASDLEAACNHELHSVQEDAKANMADLESRLATLHVAGYPRDAMDIIAHDLQSKMAKLMQTVKHLMHLIQKVKDENCLVVKNVPGDGHCGLWTYLQLLQQEQLDIRSASVQGEVQGIFQGLRERLAAAWIHAAEAPAWQHFFVATSGPKPEPAELHNTSPAAQEADKGGQARQASILTPQKENSVKSTKAPEVYETPPRPSLQNLRLMGGILVDRHDANPKLRPEFPFPPDIDDFAADFSGHGADMQIGEPGAEEAKKQKHQNQKQVFKNPVKKHKRKGNMRERNGSAGSEASEPQGECGELDEQGQRKKRRVHAKTPRGPGNLCKAQFKEIRAWLACLGYTYPIFSREHQVLIQNGKKSFQCEGGGYVALQQALIARSWPNCGTCEEGQPFVSGS